MPEPQVAVVGAGPAGVAAAVALKDRRLRPLLIDQADEVASTWRARYDRLRLNTCRPYSHLPGRRFAKGTPMFPSRDQLVAHLDHHAREDGIDLQLGTNVDRIERSNGGWALRTSVGEVHVPQVVVSTGYESEPIVPDWPGRDLFEGELMHSREYRNAKPFADRVVLVVGPGCSGMEIAHDIAEGGARKVWLSARTPPNILLRTGPGGIPGDMIAVVLLHLPARVGDAVARFGRKQDLGDLTEYGLPIPEEGVMSRLHRTGQAPAIVDTEVIESIRARRIEMVPGVESLDRTGVQLVGGSRVEPEVVICATGYNRRLEPLVGHLDVLDERGMPRALAPRSAAPGMRFVGYVPRPGGLGYMGKEARRAARAIAGELG
ncbi:MAG: NAD(P)/FAD-dependent oxidoreductase [Thermoleophilaceae bacterium]|jgi:cation diffusion facilitator CzcD-associated flavoprotein CzcO